MSSTNKILVDTSVWIDFFRSGKSKHVECLIDYLKNQRVVLCGIVELEIVQGVRNKETEIVEDFFGELEYVDISRSDFQLAGNLISRMRKIGITESFQDSLIAAVCINHKLKLLTNDSDFRHFPDLSIVNLD